MHKRVVKIPGLAVCLMAALAIVGCHEGAGVKRGGEAKKSVAEILAGYEPVKIEILGLSEFKANPHNKGVPLVKLFVAIEDAFGTAMKYPCVLRFELYEHTVKSPLARGKRVMLWPDFDLTEAAVNSVQYKDYLRAYAFDIDVQGTPGAGKTYIIEATCVLATGKRLSCQTRIKYE